MKLTDIGYNERIERYAIENNINELHIGRIISEQKDRYIVFTVNGEYEAEITGNMRFSAQGREDFPAVGDWVVLSLYENNFAIINSIFPRYSVIKRRAIEKEGDVQIIATNIEYALIVQAADRDFNLNRLERYLTICNDSNIKSLILITKIDLLTAEQSDEIKKSINSRVKNVPIISLSNKTLEGVEDLKNKIIKGCTYCLLGSSGVGKSSLINTLSGKNKMKTGEISTLTNKGKHITSSRELVVLDSGGILIDNPGMREVGIVDNDSGFNKTFNMIIQISNNCRFSDCTHRHEAGCAILNAVKNGEIEKEIYDNFIKIEKEKEFFASTKAEIHKKDKDFGKMLKTYKKDKSHNKF